MVVDGKNIYPLQHRQPVIIGVDSTHPQIVVTNGFHISPPLELEYDEPSYYEFVVECRITDLQLAGGAFCMIFCYLLGFRTGFIFFKALSFLPIALLLFYYYWRRNNFIRLHPVRH